MANKNRGKSRAKSKAQIQHLADSPITSEDKSSNPPIIGSETPQATPVPLGNYSVIVDHVSVQYIAEVDAGEVRKSANSFQRLAHKVLRRPFKKRVLAVDDVSFRARTGESIGLLGSNGAGKSTLMRMLAGVEVPTSGKILARSQPELLGVSAALIPSISGFKNIQLGCLAMGLTPKEVTEAVPKIIDLAGIGDSIYRPMQTYSSGMAARLRFAINAASIPDILLIDEALGTGDATFAARSERVLTEIREAAGTVFIVSHAAETIEKLCTRAIWLHEGRIIADGAAYGVARAYRWWAWQVAQGEYESATQAMKRAILDYGAD